MPAVCVLPDQTVVECGASEAILPPALRAGIPFAHACGGNAICSTCRVVVVNGAAACAPRTPKELAASEKVSAPSMTRTVAGLVEGGLVARAGDPTDGRSVILSLTPEGRRTIRDIRRRRDQWFAARLEKLTDDERAVLAQATALLERVAAE